MEFEGLKRGHIKRNVIIGSFVVLFISAVILNFTRAKYKTAQDVPIASGTINYELGDANLIGIYLQNGDDYTKSDTIPDSGYTLNEEESYCKIGDEVQSNMTITYDVNTKKLNVSPLSTKGTKCYLYFDEQNLLKDAILANSTRGTGTPDFSKTSCTSKVYNGTSRTCGEQTVGLYETTTSKGTTYYFRGDVDDNYLVFANKYWRIIRINEDGSIRIIYSGEKSTVDSAGKETVLANGYNDEITRYTQIQTSAFNAMPNFNRSEHVGFRYTEGSQRPSNPNTGDSSTIKGVLDTWYSSNLQAYDSMIISTPGFCNDREMRTGYTWSSQPSSSIYYKAYERLYTNKTPSFECNNDNDLYQTKIGLITADEVAYAGGKYGSNSNNYGYYLYTGNWYWTMYPYYFSSSCAYVFRVDINGFLSNDRVSSMYGVRPVINLSSDTTIKSGNGTISSVYEI